MSTLARTGPAIDIHFGAPKDIELLNKPYGFYEFLGVPRDALVAVIKRAVQQKSFETHPDRGGKVSEFKAVQSIADTLLDDGGELGREHSKRTHYDRISALDDYFDGFVEEKSSRTKRLSEILLMRLQLERKYAEMDLEMNRVEPEFAALRPKLDQPDLPASEKKRVMQRLMELVMKHKGMPEAAAQEAMHKMEERQQQEAQKQQEFFDSLRADPTQQLRKILDILYIGTGQVTFGSDLSSLRFGFVGHEKREKVLELILAGERCYLAGLSRVHFKAEKANVVITDPHIHGLFHVVEGKVTVRYEGISYGEVIRARAPQLKEVSGFEREGDLFVPSRLATDPEWWKKKPAVDIAVKEGEVSLSVRSQEFSSYSGDYYSSISLDSIISKNYYNLKKNIIKKY